MGTRIDKLRGIVESGEFPPDRLENLRALSQLSEVDPGLAQGFLEYASRFSNESHQAPRISPQMQGDFATKEEMGRAALDFVPVVGELLAVRDVVNFAREGHNGLALLAATGLLPLVPDQIGKIGAKKGADLIDRLRKTHGAGEFDNILQQEIGDVIPFNRPPGSGSHSAETILRLQRAQEQGFDIANPQFHATPSDIDFERFFSPEELAAGGHEFGIHAGTVKSSRQKVAYNLQRTIKDPKFKASGSKPELNSPHSIGDQIEAVNMATKEKVSGKIVNVSQSGGYFLDNGKLVYQAEVITPAGPKPKVELSPIKAGVRTVPIFLKRGKRAFLPDPGTWADPEGTLHTLEVTLGNVKSRTGRSIEDLRAAAASVDPNVGPVDRALMTDLTKAAREVQDETLDFRKRAQLWHGKFRETLKKHGYDSVDYLNEAEDVGSVSSFVLDPQQVRSVFAKFDPSKTDSPDLMAGIAGLLGLQVARQAGKEDEGGN